MQTSGPQFLKKAGNYAMLFPYYLKSYLQIVARRFVDDGCQHSAAALTYMSLFAVVPMMTVTFSMFSLMPVFKGAGVQVEQLIVNWFLPVAGEEIQSYLSDFASQARKLSVIGVGILVVTAYLMLRNIERVFNRIWSTTGPRKGVAAFLLYWAVLSLGPLLLGTAIVMNTYVVSVRLLTEPIAQSMLDYLLGYLPFTLTALAFTLLYTVVPNCQVMLRNALTGGVVAALAFELAKSGFGYFVANSSYTSIYGAFAALPVFLLWVYLCWMIILAGAEFVRATENFGAEIKGSLPDYQAATLVLWLFWRAHHAGLEVAESQSRKIGITSDSWRRVQTNLLAANIISMTENGHYVLKRDLNDLSLWDLIQLFPSSPGLQGKQAHFTMSADTAWWNDYQRLLEQYDLMGQDMLCISLSELFAAENGHRDDAEKPSLLKESNVSNINQ